MQMAANNNLILTDFLSFSRVVEREKLFSHGGLYQEIARTVVRGLHTNQAIADFAGKLASVADHAYGTRQFDIVGYVSRLFLMLPPSRQLESMGHYYLALSLNRGTQGDIARANSLFERVADQGPLRYQARAMLALGTKSCRTGDYQTAMSFYREVMQKLTSDHVFDLATFCVASRMSAVIRGLNGDHRGAIADLERLLPIARMAGSQQPHTYYDYLNNVAVELGEVGRLEEARRVSQKAITSPYASAYHEWHETLDEINLKTRHASRSMVAVSQVASETPDSPPQIVSWPGEHVRRSESATLGTKNLARVIDLQDWKKKVEKKSKGSSRKKPTREQISSMDFTEKQATITRCIYADEATEEMLDSILQLTLAPEAGERDGV
jgi:tetratricopeptide (TPR) repeat protein